MTKTMSCMQRTDDSRGLCPVYNVLCSLQHTVHTHDQSNSKKSINQLTAVARGLAVRVHCQCACTTTFVLRLSILCCNGFIDKKIDLPEGKAGYCAKDRKGRVARH